MTEAFTLIGAIGGIVTLGVLFYREVRKRADLEKKLHGYNNLKDFYAQLAAEYEELHEAYEKLNDFAEALEQTVVNNLEPADLVDAINSVLQGFGSADTGADNN